MREKEGEGDRGNKVEEEHEGDNTVDYTEGDYVVMPPLIALFKAPRA